jgi:hypothetical protein
VSGRPGPAALRRHWGPSAKIARSRLICNKARSEVRFDRKHTSIYYIQGRRLHRGSRKNYITPGKGVISAVRARSEMGIFFAAMPQKPMPISRFRSETPDFAVALLGSAADTPSGK